MEAATRRLAGVGHGAAAAVAATGAPSTHHPVLWTATRGPAGATMLLLLLLLLLMPRQHITLSYGPLLMLPA